MILQTRRRPLRVMFLLTSMPVGGAETLLANLVRRLDRTRIEPEITCLKQRDALGDQLADELPVHSELIGNKFDLRVFARLHRLFRSRQVDAVVTVGAGDKMFWGRIAARTANVPIVVSALHSTGWPDGVGRLNRLLTPLTDAFIAVAGGHAKHLVEREGFPRDKVHTIPNGVDVERFTPGPSDAIRAELGIPLSAPVVGIIAALRGEKNH
ncbi:MAG: glycosyltransferase, partial [Planctomycetota bacterium]